MKPMLVVLGGSSGSLQPLVQLVGGLPHDLDAAVFVVMHLPPWHPSALPDILSRSSPLPAKHPAEQEKIEPGVVYVAPPDRHMIVEDSEVKLWRGPKEDRHRPSINALFRSAAVEGRERVIGAVLSGTLEDGATGLYWIKQYGGTTIVQDPETATASGMPLTALQNVNVDHVAPPLAMGPLITRLIDAAKANSDLKRRSL